MSAVTPIRRPNLDPVSVVDLVAVSPLPDDYEGLVLVGIRGYYLDSMGKKGLNDRGIYDDALALLVFEGDQLSTYQTFNFNVDPSVNRRGIAVLDPGLWWYKRGVHGLSKPPHLRYEALVQAREVQLDRDGPGGVERGFFGINIHRGGSNSTGSLGCQTVPSSQWDDFISSAFRHMRELRQTQVPYLLVTEQDRRAQVEWRETMEAGIKPIPPRPVMDLTPDPKFTILGKTS